MSDFSLITPRLFTGAALTAGPTDVAALHAAGITHVIACNESEDDNALLGAGFTCLLNPTADDGTHKAPEWFDKSIQFAVDALSHHHARVLAHCAAGVNRGPSTAYAIMRALGFSATDAETLIRAARPQVGLGYKVDADAAIMTLGWG